MRLTSCLGLMTLLAAMIASVGCELTSKDEDSGASAAERATAKLRAELGSKDADNIDSLIDKGADVNSTDNQGVTPLHLAAINGHKQSASLLLASGAKVNAVDKQRRTPLYWAVSNGHYDTVKILIGNDADPTIIPKASDSLLDIARKRGHVRIAEVLNVRSQVK